MCYKSHKIVSYPNITIDIRTQHLMAELIVWKDTSISKVFDSNKYDVRLFFIRWKNLNSIYLFENDLNHFKKG